MAKKLAKKAAPRKKAAPKKAARKKNVAKRTAKKKTAVVKAPATKTPSTPAAKPEVNKSKAIRDYQTKNPNAAPKAVAEALAKQGIDVTPTYVNTIKATEKKKTAGKPGGAAKAKPDAANITMSNLMKAKQLAEVLGGAERAKAALDALDKLQQ